ncbi:hypothetical protein NV226_00825 [Mycoplasma iguanae]|uniref:Uncharacterized protein n=1 Tax=Mycoplasma iguanae TaxID=292461 RepID=A0ABY5RBW9_9MOLU|nr:hypothetical protein [Mycoplasma iguanae]UVD81837.1 hypothetical protein NV226_00825 [Mycoplasma iguanae]
MKILNKLKYAWQKINLAKKWKMLLLVSLIIGLVPITFVTIELIKKNQTEKYSLFDDKQKLTETVVFPKIDISDFYDYLEYKGNKLLISDNFIAAIIQETIKTMNKTTGKITFNYKKINDQSVEFHFKWTDQNLSEVNNFQIDLS